MKKYLAMGSPPLARGTACCAVCSPCGPGITPACAGTRLVIRNRQRIRRDHPRLRGEQMDAINANIDAKGSPPLARGTALAFIAFCQGVGITPACAGNRGGRGGRGRRGRDHPRLRGEQTGCHAADADILGSPPLARGTGTKPPTHCNCCRITPACAGNSQNPAPRMKCYLGSPPLARGTVKWRIPSAYPCGITPACAGNRLVYRLVPAPDRDHPRLRGEQIYPTPAIPVRGGSPPLARGTV